MPTNCSRSARRSATLQPGLENTPTRWQLDRVAGIRKSLRRPSVATTGSTLSGVLKNSDSAISTGCTSYSALWQGKLGECVGRSGSSAVKPAKDLGEDLPRRSCNNDPERCHWRPRLDFRRQHLWTCEQHPSSFSYRMTPSAQLHWEIGTFLGCKVPMPCRCPTTHLP